LTRPVSWSTSYLLRDPLGISMTTSNCTAGSFSSAKRHGVVR
jgi:hypothetical protein